MTKPLRVVGQDEVLQPKKKLTITEAANAGDQRDLLVALRERVAKAVQDVNCPPRDLAALSRRLIEIAKEIEAIDVKNLEDGDDSATPDEGWEAI